MLNRTNSSSSTDRGDSFFYDEISKEFSGEKDKIVPKTLDESLCQPRTSGSAREETTWLLSNSVSHTRQYPEQLKADKDTFKNAMMQSIDNSIFEYGFSSQAENFLNNYLSIIGPLAREWINEIYLENIKNEEMIVGLLRVISHLPYESLYPVGMTIAAASLSHQSNRVKENGIRAFENWEDKRSIVLLEVIECSDPSLRKYRDQVIQDLRGM